MLTRIPDIPGLPKLPAAPTTPDVPNTPGQPNYEPGTLPQGLEPNAAPLEPGKLPVASPPKKLDTPSCAGRNRADCYESDE